MPQSGHELRNDQDRAYQASVEADKRKEMQRLAKEAEERERAEKALKIQQELEEREEQRKQKIEKLKSIVGKYAEPAPLEPAVNLSVQLVGGMRIVRRFSPASLVSVQPLKTFK